MLVEYVELEKNLAVRCWRVGWLGRGRHLGDIASSASFLGLWTPPNTDSFQQAMGIGAMATLVVSIAFAVLAVVRGSGVARWVALVPATFGVLILLVVVFDAVVEAFG
jgi:hypothetical protein